MNDKNTEMLQRSMHTYNGNSEVEATNLFCVSEAGETGRGQERPTTVGQIS